jgi:hypothetical protein
LIPAQARENIWQDCGSELIACEDVWSIKSSIAVRMKAGSIFKRVGGLSGKTYDLRVPGATPLGAVSSEILSFSVDERGNAKVYHKKHLLC